MKMTAEEMVASFVDSGILQVLPNGSVWRRKRKFGGNQGPVLKDIEPVRTDKRLPNGYRQIQIYVDGARIVCSAHRLIWFLTHGPIPDGFHVHHKNGDRSDNKIENLECVEGAMHIAHHGLGRPPPNRGTAYGKTLAYKKSHASRMSNHGELCARTYALWRDGLTQARVAEIMGISRRQVCDRLRSYRANSHDE